MNRKTELKIMLKTSMYCLAIFLMICAAFYYYITNNYQVKYNGEYQIQIVTAKVDIPVNTVIEESMLDTKIVNQSFVSENMVSDFKKIVGEKVLTQVKKGDIFRKHELIEKSVWYANYERIIVLPMDIEQRLGNLVKKGSLVDIKLRQQGTLPKVVLSKIMVDEIIDENGIPASNDVGAKKTFAKLILNEEQRNRLYASMDFGKPFVELYCNSIQDKIEETFAIPPEYNTNQITAKQNVKNFH